MSICKVSEIPRNEAYIEVRRSDLPCSISFAVWRGENLTGRGIRVPQPFDLTQGRGPAERPFGFTQGYESFGFAQDRELVERLVDWQMGVFRQPLY